MSDIVFEAIEAEISRFLHDYPVSWIGRRPERWQEDKMGEVREDLSTAIVKCGRLMDRLEAVGRGYRNYAELQKALLETRSGLEHEFAKYEMYGVGTKGIPRPQFGIHSKPSRRSPEKLPEHLREG